MIWKDEYGYVAPMRLGTQSLLIRNNNESELVYLLSLVKT